MTPLRRAQTGCACVAADRGGMSGRNEKQSRLGDFHHLPSFVSPPGAQPAALSKHHKFNLGAFVSPRSLHASRILSVWHWVYSMSGKTKCHGRLNFQETECHDKNEVSSLIAPPFVLLTCRHEFSIPSKSSPYCPPSSRSAL